MAMRVRTSSRPLFTSLGILDVYNLHELAVSTFVYDLHKGHLPHSLTQYYELMNYNYRTWGKEHAILRLPKCKTTHGTFLFLLLEQSSGIVYLKVFARKEQGFHFAKI